MKRALGFGVVVREAASEELDDMVTGVATGDLSFAIVIV